MSEIFVALVDSIHIDFRVGFKPPPPYPEGTIITDSLRKIHDSIREINLADYRRKLDSVRRDTSKLFIAVDDTIFPFKKTYLKLIDQPLDTSSESFHAAYKIDLTQFKDNNLFRFLYRSELPPGNEMWQNKNINGSVGFSRIAFDESKSFGVLSGGFGCGKLCGKGVLIFIKKINGHWVIEKIKITEIS